MVLTVKPLSDSPVVLTDFVSAGEHRASEPLTVAFSDTLQTPVGLVVVQPGLSFSDVWLNVPIKVSKEKLKETALHYNKNLQSTLASKTATIINLSINDASEQRAEDVINGLIAIYNEDAIDDKNTIAVNTSNFINDRLIVIEKELGGVDTEIESFKRENQLTDIRSETGMYLESSSRFMQEGLGLENQLMLSKYIHQYLVDPSKSTDLIPANTGISDVSIENQISEYNDLLLKRDKLIANSSDRNPVVMDLNKSLAAMRQSIIRTVDNLIASLNMKIRNVREQETQTQKRISAVPTQQKYVLSVERQQKIKEALYLYLLNKREENALSQSITESNARILDPAAGSSTPVSPKASMILLAALVIGCAIPAGIIWLINILDTRVRTRADLEKVLAAPILDDIPEMKRKVGADKEALVA